ncbi:hypothetical protein [Nocardioides sp. Iso805N]|uniref:hypothetical protein n=1 Tax=Nocardioides sp. Iso805N TaxID=1283287 RepID=UPI00035DB7A8|nr:hypothetical protein [Nocardioides sp. Iso805N]
MTESSTPEHQLPAPGFVPRPFWADPIEPGAAWSGAEDEAETAADAFGDGGAAATGTPAGAQLPGAPMPGLQGFEIPRPGIPIFEMREDLVGPEPYVGQEAVGTDNKGDDAPDEPGDADEGDGDADADADGPEDAEDAEADADDDEEDAPGQALRRRFEELVEERLRRARYAHHLTRPVFTPTESAMASLVERRASVWVPTMTFVATIVSAIAAVVLATRLRSDPTDPSGNQLIVVTITVCLLAAAFATLLRAEVHYERLRPRGRVVRHDVADAYEVVRDAPRRLVQNDAPIDVLRRIAGLLATAEQLVDALAAYSADGGTRVRAHPAYERILRMRAEVEALEFMLEEQEKTAVPDPVHGVDTPLPKPEHVASYNGLVDLAESLIPDE